MPVWILAGTAASKLVLHISNVRQGARVFASTDCATGWNMNSMVAVHNAEPNVGTDSKHHAAHERQFTTYVPMQRCKGSDMRPTHLHPCQVFTQHGNPLGCNVKTAVLHQRHTVLWPSNQRHPKEPGVSRNYLELSCHMANVLDGCIYVHPSLGQQGCYPPCKGRPAAVHICVM